MTGLEVALTLLIVLILLLILSAIFFVQWWRRKFRQEHCDVGSVTGHSTRSAASKEMMYFMCWENSSQVAALGVLVSPSSTNKEMPPAMITTHKEPPAMITTHKEPPAMITTHKEPPAMITTHKKPPAFVGLDMHRAPRRPPPASPPPPPPPPLPWSPPVTPMKLRVQGRMDQPPKPQVPARDVDQYKLPSSPPGYNVSYKVYPRENRTLFANKEVLDDGERRRSSATKITASSVFRQPSTELVFTTPAQSPPFYTPVSSPLHTSTEGEVSSLHTSPSLPSSKDVVERLYHKKVEFKDTPDHVKIMVG